MAVCRLPGLELDPGHFLTWQRNAMRLGRGSRGSITGARFFYCMKQFKTFAGVFRFHRCARREIEMWNLKRQ